MRGGLLHETTKAWIGLVLVICHAMKSGYKCGQQKEEGPTEKGQGRENGENGEKIEEKKEGKDGQGKGFKDGDCEGKCPVRPRSLNFGQRSQRVIRFRRQQSHHFAESATSSGNGSGKMKKLFKMSH